MILLIGVLAGLAAVALARAHPDDSLTRGSPAGVLLLLGAGCGLVVAGAAAWRRRPGSRFGALLAAGGLAFLVPEFANSQGPSAVVFTVGVVGFAAAAPIVAHAALAYPCGRVDRKAERAALAIAYAGAVGVLGIAHALVYDPRAEGCHFCPANLLAVHDDRAAAELVERAGIALGVAWSIGLLALLVAAIVRSTPAARRTRAPLLAAAGACLAFVAADYLYSLGRGTLSTGDVDRELWTGQAVALAVVALMPLAPRMRARRSRMAVARLAVEFGEAPPLGRLRDALARAVGDPALELAFPVGERFLDPEGRPVMPVARDGATVTSLLRGARPVAVLVHRAGLLDDPALVEELSAAARLSLEHERLQAEARGQLDELSSSRAGAVRAGDRERRRLERDLHDGAQQRLVGLALALRLLRSGLSPSAVTHVDAADRQLHLALAELRELARGIYPAALAEDGLAAALEALAESATIPVVLDDLPEERAPDPTEAAAYFVVAHTLKHAAPARITVRAQRHDGDLVVELIAGGATEVDFAAVEDRVLALDGRLSVERSADASVIRAELPCVS